ncbi:MAG: hybrid sensor histidine kinase/response regulator [Chloroherpetonaceae bacterium]|nr:ATP-binding protein [Chthonomonadaceae bacterium]MDW8208426.1 hybrid sensor histidine kinase/response regulator [Chloroherpetonaceae bacterium]
MSQPVPLFDVTRNEDTAQTTPPVLIADTDPVLRRVLATVFSTAGYSVTCAEDGQEVLELVQRQSFPLLIFSIDLPKVDGIRLTRALAERDTFAVCLLLALPEQLDLVLEAAENGNVYNHFWKPIRDVGDLARAAARALEQRELRRRNAYLLTELRDARSELKALHARLEQLDRVNTLGQMTQAMTTDLEKSLAGLKAYAHYLRERLERQDTEPLNARQMERIQAYMQDMESSIARCHASVQSMRDYVCPQDDTPGPVTVRTVLEDCLHLLTPGLQEQNIQIQVDFSGEIAPVLAHPHRLRQALTNLILNARQAMPGGGTLLLAITALKDEFTGKETAVQVHITDTGTGISADVLPHIFEPFFTTHVSEKQLGLGLTVARQIVEEWRGRIDVDSAPGRGTTVTLTLPVCAEVAVPVRSGLLQEQPAPSQKAA